MHKYYLLLVVALVGTAQAGILNIDFEGYPDSTVLSNQYPLLQFSNATILTAGLSLNELQTPPRSGDNVAQDTGGRMEILFGAPVLEFSGYFTYNTAVKVSAYNSLDQLVGSTDSLFSNNFVGSPNPQNELLAVTFAGGILRVTLEGNLNGSSFVVDDMIVRTADAVTVPEPGTWLLVVPAGYLLWRRRMA